MRYLQGADVGRRHRDVERLQPRQRGLSLPLIAASRHPADERHRRQHPAEPGDDVVDRRDQAVDAVSARDCASAMASSAQTITSDEQRDRADEFAQCGWALRLSLVRLRGQGQ